MPPPTNCIAQAYPFAYVVIFRRQPAPEKACFGSKRTESVVHQKETAVFCSQNTIRESQATNPLTKSRHNIVSLIKSRPYEKKGTGHKLIIPARHVVSPWQKFETMPNPHRGRSIDSGRRPPCLSSFAYLQRRSAYRATQDQPFFCRGRVLSSWQNGVATPEVRR